MELNLTKFGGLNCRDFHRSPLWDEAFNLYNDHNHEQVKVGCRSCACKVTNWIKKNQKFQANNFR